MKRSGELEKQVAELKAFIKSRPDGREMMRALAVKLVLQGRICQDVATILDVSTTFVSDWHRAYQEDGIAGLRLGYKGAEPYLNAAEKATVVDWIKSQNQWGLTMLHEHLQEHYGVTYKSAQSYYSLLAEAGITYKQAQQDNPKANDEQVAKKKRKSKRT